LSIVVVVVVVVSIVSIIVPILVTAPFAFPGIVDGVVVVCYFILHLLCPFVLLSLFIASRSSTSSIVLVTYKMRVTNFSCLSTTTTITIRTSTGSHTTTNPTNIPMFTKWYTRWIILGSSSILIGSQLTTHTSQTTGAAAFTKLISFSFGCCWW